MKSSKTSNPTTSRILRKLHIRVCYAMIWSILSITIRAQDVVVVQEGGASVQVAPGAMPPGAMPPGAVPPNDPSQSGPNAKPGNESQKTGEAAKDAKTSAVEPIKRKSEPPDPPNKREFDIKPDEQGMLQFQFRNQAWPDLMRWLAEVSGMSLDWQELPGDYLNIATQRKHTLDEARDLFNRHLLARGFTMLEFDGTIQVLKTAGINAALVPKIDPQKLSSLPPSRFVRTSFPLNTLIAADVVAELKPLISNNGALNALAATNRLEAMDTAANLSELHRILSEEQSTAALESLAREFTLEHVRAADVREQLLQFLGLETKKPPASREQQMMEMQQQQMMMQMQQQQPQQSGANNKQKPKAEIYIVANTRRNSVIAHAPPDKMAVIAAFVRRVDVPNENADSLQSLETRTQVYRLVSLDPKQLVSSLLAMDAMEPNTRLEVDEKNKAIIAYASLSDHFTIKKMIERLDGSARDVDVIQLRRLRAEDVAGTIKFLMGNEEKKDDNSRARSYFFYDPFGSMNNKKDTTTDVFRVAANSQDNQVLIWANEIERAEVRKLLIKLGELPPDGGNPNRVRVIDGNRSDETKAYLKRLQDAWSKISPTPLELPDDSEFEPADAKKSPAAEVEPESKATEPTETPDKKKAVISESNISQHSTRDRDQHLSILGIPAGMYTSNRFDADESDPQRDVRESSPPFSTPANTKVQADENQDSGNTTVAIPTTIVRNPANSPEKNKNVRTPIRITFDERGNLVLIGDDTEALSKLEQWMIDNSPPQRGYEVYIIKHSTPSWIKISLEDYYKEDKENKRGGDSFYRWLFDGEPQDKKEDAQLGKKRKLRFLSDNDTKSLIVIGADDAQLKTIEGLIRLWDVPEKTNKQKLRYSKLVQVEYSKAEGIVDAIKDAFRDLLSTNDKAFQKEKEGNGGGGSGNTSKRNDSDESIVEGGMSYSFSGRLSLGVDKATNSIIVSAEGENLLTLVCEMVKQLDVAAKPNGSVEILKLGSANGTALEKALSAWTKANDGKVVENDPDQPNQQNQNLNQFQNGNQPSNVDRGNRRKK